jgi:hypothetical protein
LTSLTTSFSIDILEIDKKKAPETQEHIRKKTHILFSCILIATILVFKYFISDESVIAKIFTFANYTYGPLLGLYAFGLFTKIKVKDKMIPFICLASPVLSYVANTIALASFRFDFGFSLLILNGLITFVGLYLFKNKTQIQRK